MLFFINRFSIIFSHSSFLPVNCIELLGRTFSFAILN
jgi:hypothetical protein